MAKNRHAVALGRKGGRARSEAKTLAVRENGRKGGRPTTRTDDPAKTLATQVVTRGERRVNPDSVRELATRARAEARKARYTAVADRRADALRRRTEQATEQAKRRDLMAQRDAAVARGDYGTMNALTRQIADLPLASVPPLTQRDIDAYVSDAKPDHDTRDHEGHDDHDVLTEAERASFEQEESK